MRFCRKYNATIALFDFYQNPYMDFNKEKKKFTGKLEYLAFDFFFLKRKKEDAQDFFKYCEFIRTTEDGHLLPNGSWSGSIGLVEQNIATFNLRPGSIYIDSDKIDFSHILSSQEVIVGHFIHPKNTSMSVFDVSPVIDVFIPSIDVFLFYNGLILLTWLISFVLLFLKTDHYSIRKKIFYLFKFLNSTDKETQKANSIGILFAFYVLYLFFVRNFLSNNIKTSKVIVDQSILLYDEERIRETSLRLCFFDDSKITDFLKYSSNRTVRHYIYHNKLYEGCFMTNEMFGKKKYADDFFLVFPFYQTFGLRMLANLGQRKEDLFINSNNPIGEVIGALYLSKKIIKPLKDEIYDWTVILFEQGFLQQGYLILKFTFELDSPIKNNIYFNAQDYIESNTIVSDLNFEKIRIFYYLYILALLIILLLKLIVNFILFFFDLIV